MGGGGGRSSLRKDTSLVRHLFLISMQTNDTSPKDRMKFSDK